MWEILSKQQRRQERKHPVAKKKQKKHTRTKTRKSPAIRLSQCMIVKNEESNIRQALSWGKGIVWEQIVVDTGSTDNTVSIAEEMGAKVFRFPWNEDFSAAKNFAIDQAKGNWIAFLDADEWFAEEEAEKLLPILREVHPNPAVTAVRAKMLNLDQNGGILGAFCQDRIFRNNPMLRYRYRIHEELYWKGTEKMICLDAQDRLLILHSGYTRENQTGKGKGGRNIPILQQDVAEHPKDGMRWVYLADAYNISGDREKALECYRKVVEEPEMELTHEIAFLRAGLQILTLQAEKPARETKEEMFRVSEELRKRGWDDHPDIDYYMGVWYFKSRDLETAAELFERALKKVEGYNGLDMARITSQLDMPNQVVAAVALQQGNLQKAVQFAVTALRVNRYDRDTIQILLRAFHTEWKEGQSAEPYWQFLCKVYDGGSLKDLLFLEKFTREEGFTALQECVYSQLPEEARQQVQQSAPAKKELSVEWSLSYQ